MNGNMSRFSSFLNSLERSISEAYTIYNEIDPGAMQLKTIAEDDFIGGESDDPVYLRFKSYLVGQDDIIMDSAFIDEQSKLMCRLFFVTKLHNIAIDVVIDLASLEIQSDIAYCEKATDDEYGYSDNYTALPDQTYDELDQAARSLSLLGRIRNS